MPVRETLGNRLARERRRKAHDEDADLDGKDIAKAVGVSASTYSRYEADLTKPDDDTMAKLANYFGVTRGWLRFGEGERLPPSTTEVKLSPHAARSRPTAKAVGRPRKR